MKVNFQGAQWVGITKRYATFYCRPESSFLKSKSHFSVTALTDAAGNPEADIFSLQGTSSLLCVSLINTVQRTTGSYYAIKNSIGSDCESRSKHIFFDHTSKDDIADYCERNANIHIHTFAYMYVYMYVCIHMYSYIFL